MTTSGHIDRFVIERLPPPSLMPDFDYSAPHLQGWPDRMNAAAELVDRACALGLGESPATVWEGVVWSFSHLQDRSQRIARMLVEDWGMVPGDRVLLRGANSPMLLACWLGVVRAGGIAVTTMPLLRAKELGFILERVQIQYALCEDSLAEEMTLAADKAGGNVRLGLFSPVGQKGTDFDRKLEAKPAGGGVADTSADDPALIVFTSGTTGNPKAAVHYHRDVIAVAESWPREFGIRAGDVHAGSPSMAFSYGFGAFIAFPLRHGCCSVMLPKAAPDAILNAISKHRVTSLFAVPTSYNAMMEIAGGYDLSSLRFCASAGEHLRDHTFRNWRDATGMKLVNGIGSTEMLNHFIAQPVSVDKPGSTGRLLPGYSARIVDKDGNSLPSGEKGWLAVKGPVGCRYFDDPERQKIYVRQGWNVTGDIFERDGDGWFWYIDRGDDMIVSSGYNISAQEVEQILIEHPKIKECAVVGAPDDERGQIVKAFVVLKEGAVASDDLAHDIQEFVKHSVAPYKYPRLVRFLDELPKTATGKIQRYLLKEME
ncbi:MAG: AMP-binding protein [Alphaproteobacteria bacterium]|nr:AMP-binding protein [Alphaproteobacteria bacterium]